MIRRHGFLRAVTLSLITTVSLLATVSNARAATKRDHLTPLEVEQVRAAQLLDKRIEVFIKVAERRLLLLADPQAASSKQMLKETEKWGEPPAGTRAELFTDLAKILDEAITNIDDVAARDASNRLLPKSLRKLAVAANKFIGQLAPMRAQAKDETERDALEQAMENAQAVIEAANRLPAETKEDSKSEKKKDAKP